MLIWAAVGGVALVVLFVGVFAIAAVRQARRRRRSLRHIARPPAPGLAYRAVVNARSAFTRSVQAYEEALAAASASSSGSSSGLAGPGDAQTQAVDLTSMEVRKDDRRTRLLEAQRVWEMVRPATGPDSPVNAWLGAGELRAWSLGLVGHETSFIRLEHAVDPSCWVVVEMRRLRFGPAVGVERLKLGIVVEGADIQQLTGVLQVAMGSPEVAIRPGMSILRWLARLRLEGKVLFDALRGSADRSGRLFLDGLGPGTRKLSLKYLSEVRGIDLDRTHGGLAGGFERISLRISSSGPSFLVGLWFGRRPAPRILAGSNHQAWLRKT
jgi:hypothetical protein